MFGYSNFSLVYYVPSLWWFQTILVPAMLANSSISDRPCGHWDIDDASLFDFCMDTFTQLGPVI